ncbi:Glu/Leu/Phe/Val dehydrogenase dimerization domain-containing protein [Haloglycomyces albus]|uniref:Glu/Leu/Phe/Val dehydrogenase dimerization domain-containing protein n=1 Tax=Haloglycomyces albus TaxID=526067 RepID=UPI00046D7EE4|nr:Glu/Leu/Phe/Val dehydrogenase dimerization domain-containing protein [Haloglycomyces albus]
MGIFDPRESGRAHEQVVFCHDPESGLRAIIAVHSTALGPGLGGTRFHNYASEEEALDDVLRLSEGMSYKNALAGLDLGGGKAVIWGDPTEIKSEALLRAYGRFVQSLHGRYITACDVGTYVQDMDIVARESEYVTGRSPDSGGAGDSSILTALGVFTSMRAAARHRFGTDDLYGKQVGVAGVGKVGKHLIGHLSEAGADIYATDVNPAAHKWVKDNVPHVNWVHDNEMLMNQGLHIYAPCALGGVINAQSVSNLKADIVCGAANNQLDDLGIAHNLREAGVLYCPDYLVNAGGVIQVADEYYGAFNFDRAKRRTEAIGTTLASVLQRAESDGTTTVAAADTLAEERMDSIARLRRIRLS